MAFRGKFLHVYECVLLCFCLCKKLVAFLRECGVSFSEGLRHVFVRPFEMSEVRLYFRVSVSF